MAQREIRVATNKLLALGWHAIGLLGLSMAASLSTNALRCLVGCMCSAPFFFLGVIAWRHAETEAGDWLAKREARERRQRLARESRPKTF